MDSKPKPSNPHSTKLYQVDNDISKLQHKTYQDDNNDENLSNEISDYNYQYQDTTVPPINNYICPSCSCQCYQLKHYHNNNFNNSLSLHPPCIHCGSLSKTSDHVHAHPHENIYDTPSSGKATFSPLTHFTTHSECNLTPFYGHQVVSSTPNSNPNPHQIRLKKKMHQHQHQHQRYHYKPNTKFGYSKFSIEIRCLNASSRKSNEDVMKRVATLEEKLNEKESTINNLLNNIMFLENQLNNYRNENEMLKNNSNNTVNSSKHALKKTNNETSSSTYKNKTLEDIIKQLKQDNKLLEQENKNLKVDNVTLYQMVQDKTITHPQQQQHIIQRDAPPIQPIFIKQNFLNNKEDDTVNQESEQEQEDAPNIQVINNKHVLPSSTQFTRQQQISYQPSISVHNDTNTNHYRNNHNNEAIHNKTKQHDVSNMESFQECEENPLTSSRAGNDGNNSDNTSSDVNYNNKIKDIKQHIASLNSGISSSRNVRHNNNNNSNNSNSNDKMKYETVHVDNNTKNKLELISEPNMNMPLHTQKTMSNPFHIEINKSQTESQSQMCMHKQTLSPIFTLYDKKRVLCFDPETKTFSLIEFSDLSQQFENNFKPEGSLYLSLNNSLYIITGSYYDTLYHFSLNERTLRKISHLNHNHCKGGFIYLYTTNEFLCISGTSNKYIETCGLSSHHKHSYSNNNSNSNSNHSSSFTLHPKNKTSHHWALLSNELTVERSQSMFIVQNNKYIFAFFGFCYPQNKYLNSIEYCEIQTNNNNNACKLGKWKLIQVVANVENISLHLKGHFIFAIGSSQENEEGLIVLGGVDGRNNMSVMNYIEIGFEEGEEGLMVNIRPINKNIVDINVNKVYYFNQGVPACAFSKSYGSILLFDQAFNVHMINREELSHDIYYFE